MREFIDYKTSFSSHDSQMFWRKCNVYSLELLHATGSVVDPSGKRLLINKACQRQYSTKIFSRKTRCGVFY